MCTVVHHTTDARIFRREIGAMLDAGIDVTSIAPWAESDATDPRHVRIAIPRAVGRRRFAAWRAARARISDAATDADVLLIHDPELLVIVPWRLLRRLHVPVVWDVHEDLPAALAMKAWLPRPLRRVLVPAVRALERMAERRGSLLLAEAAYAERFRRLHPVVLNLPPVPAQMPAGQRTRQAVYVGSITRARGLDAMLDMAPVLAQHGIALRLIGEAQSADDRARIMSTANVVWDGAMPNAEALREVAGSMVGLALLGDLPNYRHSMPTKILEYMANGCVVVATPLPLARAVIDADGVVLSSFDDVAANAAREVIALCDDVERRERLAAAAFARVQRDYNWMIARDAFIERLRELVAQRH